MASSGQPGHSVPNQTQAASNVVRLEGEQEIESNENSTQKKRKYNTPSSNCWKGFSVEYNTEALLPGGPLVEVRKGRCDRCRSLILSDSRKHGTNGLTNHHLSCERKYNEGRNQGILGFEVTGEGLVGPNNYKFDQEAVRLSLAEMIILDEQSFRMVEKQGFRGFCATGMPMFSIPGRKTVREDIVKLFLKRKDSLKSFFQTKGKGRVSITNDCWTGQHRSFITVTAHFIGLNWKLHKKIIAFQEIDGHKGDDIANSIMGVLEDWGLTSVVCCTMDNAAANDVAVKQVKQRLERMGSGNIILMAGKFLHMRCSAHILNLVVREGLAEIGGAVERIREAVKWVRASTSRFQAFKKNAQFCEVKSKKMLAGDCQTRWNSTYLMLESVEPYEEAMTLYQSRNHAFRTELNKSVGVPQAEDWVSIRLMLEYLKKFYDLTNLVSGTSYVTSHLFFKEMCDVFELIKKLEVHLDPKIQDMAIGMKQKIGKYWLENPNVDDENWTPKMNMFVYVAAVLDPRQKIKHVQKCFRTVYGTTIGDKLTGKVKETMVELFECYKKLLTPTPRPRTNASLNSSSSVNKANSLDIVRRSTVGTCSQMDISDEDEEDSDHSISELHLYLSDPQFRDPNIKEKNPNTLFDNFDILGWWATVSGFPILKEMARDLLAIPMSTVASESAFSTGGRVLNDFRSSLCPKMVEALICAEDWLRNATFANKDEEDLPEEELDAEYDEVLRQIGLPSFNLYGSEGGSSSGVVGHSTATN